MDREMSHVPLSKKKEFPPLPPCPLPAGQGVQKRERCAQKGKKCRKGSDESGKWWWQGMVGEVRGFFSGGREGTAWRHACQGLPGKQMEESLMCWLCSHAAKQGARCQACAVLITFSRHTACAAAVGVEAPASVPVHPGHCQDKVVRQGGVSLLPASSKASALEVPSLLLNLDYPLEYHHHHCHCLALVLYR